MTETDFFRACREKFPNFTFFLVRDVELGTRPYAATLRIGERMFHSRGGSAADAMELLLTQATAEPVRHAAPRGTSGDLWPGE